MRDRLRQTGVCGLRNALIIAIVLLVTVIGFAVHQTAIHLEQLSQIQAELTTTRDAQVVQDIIVAYFAEVWPDMHILRLDSTPERPGILTMHALAGGAVIVSECMLGPDGVGHNLGDVLSTRLGSLLYPVNSLADAPGGQGKVEVKAEAGMRIEILDVVGRWARISIQGTEGYLPLWFLSLRTAAFYMRPFSQSGHNPIDQTGKSPSSVLEAYFAAYSKGEFSHVAYMHTSTLHGSYEELAVSMQALREGGYRIWGASVKEYEMISANQSAVLVTYTYDTVSGHTRVLSEWWRLTRVNGVWKVAWMARQE